MFVLNAAALAVLTFELCSLGGKPDWSVRYMQNHQIMVALTIKCFVFLGTCFLHLVVSTILIIAMSNFLSFNFRQIC